MKMANGKWKKEKGGGPRPFSIFHFPFAIAMVLLFCLPAFAAAPAAAPPLEQRPLVRSQPAQQNSAPAAAPEEGLGFTRVALSLVAVVGLILFLRWGGAKLFTGQGSPGSNGLMQVIARAPVAPRQQLMLVRVGRRLVVVANSAGQMTPLSEITDADEVAELLGQLKRDKEPGTNRFASMFHRAESAFDETEAPAPPAAAGEQSPAQVRAELNTLMEKVRGMARQFR